MRRKPSLLLFLQILFVLLSLNAHGQTAESELCQKPPPIDQVKQQEVVEGIRQTFRDFEPIKNKEFQTQKELWDKYFFCLSDVSLNILDLTREKIIKRRIETEELRLSSLISAFGLEAETSEAKSVAAQVAFLTHKRDDAVQLAERAVILNPQNFEAHYVLAKIKPDLASANTAINLKPDFVPAYLLKIDTLLGGVTKLEEGEQTARYKAALETINTMLTNAALPNADLWREQREGLTALLKFTEANKKPAENAKPEAVKPLKITAQPAPGYTEDARQANLSGNIRLLVHFGADGEVKNVFVVKFLSRGLTQRAIAAAKQIKFEPETRNGVPVAAMKVIEYGFNIR